MRQETKEQIRQEWAEQRRRLARLSLAEQYEIWLAKKLKEATA